MSITDSIEDSQARKNAGKPGEYATESTIGFFPPFPFHLFEDWLWICR